MPVQKAQKGKTQQCLAVHQGLVKTREHPYGLVSSNAPNWCWRLEHCTGRVKAMTIAVHQMLAYETVSAACSSLLDTTQNHDHTQAQRIIFFQHFPSNIQAQYRSNHFQLQTEV